MPDDNGELQPWFIASDIAKALGYRDAGNLTRGLDEDEKLYSNLSTVRGIKKLSIINESGLYHAIFRSRSVTAKPFRRWVTQVVLPSIRKFGGYVMGLEKFSPAMQRLIMDKLISAYARVEADCIRSALYVLRRMDERCMRRMKTMTQEEIDEIISQEIKSAGLKADFDPTELLELAVKEHNIAARF